MNCGEADTEAKQKTKEVDEKIEKLEERFAIGEIEGDLYKKMKTKFIKERSEFSTLDKPFSFSASNLENYIDRSVEITLKLASIWSSSNYINKIFQRMLFPEGI